MLDLGKVAQLVAAATRTCATRGFRRARQQSGGRMRKGEGARLVAQPHPASPSTGAARPLSCCVSRTRGLNEARHNEFLSTRCAGRQTAWSGDGQRAPRRQRMLGHRLRPVIAVSRHWRWRLGLHDRRSRCLVCPACWPLQMSRLPQSLSAGDRRWRFELAALGGHHRHRRAVVLGLRLSHGSPCRYYRGSVGTALHRCGCQQVLHPPSSKGQGSGAKKGLPM